jgi:hypothetical protein
MRRLPLLWILSFALCQLALGQAAVTHIYELNKNLSDSQGSLLLVSHGGLLDANGYSFNANQGLTLAGGIDSSTYSIEMKFKLSTLVSWVKLIDFSNLQSDNGLYTYDLTLQLYPYPESANVFLPDTPAHVVLTRDGNTGEARAYVDGRLVRTDIDVGGIAVLGEGDDNVASFFMDDVVTTQREASAGFVDYLRVYSGVLTASEVLALNAGGVPPGLTPSRQILNLISDLATLNLASGLTNSFDAKLQAVLDGLSAANAGRRASACNQMSSFINQATAQSGKQITATDAKNLIAAAQQIKANLGCP